MFLFKKRYELQDVDYVVEMILWKLQKGKQLVHKATKLLFLNIHSYRAAPV